MDLLAERLNFTYSLSRVPGNSESGIVSQLAKREAFMSANPVVKAYKYLRSVDFSGTVEYQPYKIMYRRPAEQSKILLFIRPFTGFVWLMIALTTLLAGPIYWIIHRSSYYYKECDTGYGPLGNLKHCAWYTYGALMQQGGNLIPDADSGRVFIAFWWVFVVVVVTTYSGNLVAFLTFPSVEPSLTGVNMLLDLGRSGDMTWSIKANSFFEAYLKDSPEDRFKELEGEAERQTTIQPEAKDEVEELLEKIVVDDHAYIDWESKLDLLMKREHSETGECDFALAKQPVLIDTTAIALQKNSPWTQRFSQVIQLIEESRLMLHWRNLHWPSDNACTNFRITGASKKVTILDMSGSFCTLGLGCVFGLLIFATELLSGGGGGGGGVGGKKQRLAENRDNHLQSFTTHRSPFESPALACTVRVV